MAYVPGRSGLLVPQNFSSEELAIQRLREAIHRVMEPGGVTFRASLAVFIGELAEGVVQSCDSQAGQDEAVGIIHDQLDWAIKELRERYGKQFEPELMK